MGLETHYSARDIDARILAAIRSAGLNPDYRLAPEALGALDHFHTGGLRASLDLLDLAQIRTGHRVLDAGAGLGGSARLIASRIDCRVDCVELSADYCVGAQLLNRLTGLDDRVRIYEASALSLPFHDASFDVAWMQNVGMNIVNKQKLYAEIRRVLKPGGRFAFQEMAAGKAAAAYFPLPWATERADSCLVTANEMQALLVAGGFAVEIFEDTSEAHLSRPFEPAGPAQLSLGVYVDDLALKAANARRSLQEGQVRLVRGVFRAI